MAYAVSAALNAAEISGIVIGCLIGAAILIVLINFAAGFTTFMRTVYRHKKSDYVTKNLVLGKEYDVITAECKICSQTLDCEKHEDVYVTANDRVKLFARFFRTGESRKTALLLHGYATDATRDFACLYRFYKENGYNVLLPDLRAHGKSQGKMIGFGILDRYDIIKWLEFLEENVPGGEIVIHGISMGATAAMNASALDLPSSVKAIIADCGFTTPWDVLSLQMKTVFKLPPFPILHIAELFSKAFARYRFRTPSTAESVSHSKTPILFIHGSADIFVSVVMSKIAYDACSSRKKLVIVEGAGHAASYYKNTALYEKTVKEFLSQ